MSLVKECKLIGVNVLVLVIILLLILCNVMIYKKIRRVQDYMHQYTMTFYNFINKVLFQFCQAILYMVR